VRVVVSPRISATHDELRRLIGEGFRGVGKDGVEVHVVPNRSRWAFEGRAWPQVPRAAPVEPGARYLVQIRMPRSPSAYGYPFEWRYPKRKTAPKLTARSWHERLIAIAAHEAYHVRQFRMGMRRSEVTAERWAARALERYRSNGHAPV
jgi:hypothetical protein